ncbi:phosphoenolpyruvate/phosphate translocator [Plasmodium sp. gorilla clade G3]|nr:phosphoenolpyruvate/phosphate translocator [Plasmodium sp. gorilla clade G3]
MKVLTRTLIITIFFNLQIYIGKCLNHDNIKYIKNVPMNFHLKNTNGITYQKNKHPSQINRKITNKQAFNIPVFTLPNYKPKYNTCTKTKNIAFVNSRINQAHHRNIQVTKAAELNAIKKIKNDKKFTLFNFGNRDNIKTYEHNINKGIIDDISTTNNTYSNIGNTNGNIYQENNFNNTLTEKKPCTFLNKAVEVGKTVSLLGLWYVCNIFYNIENKKALNLLNMPITIAITQIYVGLPIFLIPWLLKLRNKPEIFYDEQELKRINMSDRNALIKGFQKYILFLKKYSSIMKQSIYHGYAHLLSVIAMGAGAISFVHIVKASAPLFAAFFSYFFMNNKMSIYTYSSLVPIVFGVSLASIKELSFTYKALYSTLSANVLSTMRAIEAKIMMGKNLDKLGRNLTPENIFALLTLSSAIFLTPALYIDSHKWKDAYEYLMNNKNVLKVLGRHVLMSGVWFYLYNQLSFISLNRLNHITHAVASTVKRVFLILTSYFIFGTKFSFLGGLGSSIAVGGTFVYSLVKKKFG